MTTGKALNGKPYAGNPHVRFDEGEVASAATPRRGSLLYNKIAFLMSLTTGIVASAVSAGVFDVAGGVLTEDKNYLGSGAGTFESTDVVDLNGHKLYIDHTALNGVTFIDSSSGEPGELHVSVATGETVSMDAADVSGNLKVVKDGAGCMLMRPKEIAVKCAEGRLDIGGRRPIHRWSFTDGSLADTGIVGGKTATEQTANSGTITYANNAVTFSGGARGDCWLNLGAGVIPASGDLTIEIWGQQNSVRNWQRMFSVGRADNYFLSMTWANYQGNVNGDMVQVKRNGDLISGGTDKLCPYNLGTKYHISMRIHPREDGKSDIFCAKRNADTGAVEKSYSWTTTAVWTPSEYASYDFYLNHGFDNDDASATYDEVRIWDCALSDDELTANAVAGPDAFPAENPRRTSEIVEPPTLLHRWSFTDGSLADSVGNSPATEKGSGAKTYQNNAVTFAGGGKGTCHLDMGTDVIPSTGNVTIELWGRRDAATHKWASMFSIGVNGNNNDSLRMAWSNSDAGNGKSDMVYLKMSGDIFFINNSMTPYTVGTFYHISMRIVQNADGSAVFTWSKRNATTGAIEKTYTANVAASKGWSLARYAGSPFLLNSGYDNDDEAATYDEVRIWGGALSDAQLTLNACLGPDKIIVSPKEGVCGEVEVAAGATLGTPADGVACSRLSGAGTLVAASALTVEEALDIAGTDTGTFTVNGDLTLAGDWLWNGGPGSASDRIAGTGTLDLAGATFVPRFANGATGVLQMADGVTITGYDQMALPSSHKFKIKYTNGRLNLVRRGLIIYVK